MPASDNAKLIYFLLQALFCVWIVVSIFRSAARRGRAMPAAARGPVPAWRQTTVVVTLAVILVFVIFIIDRLVIPSRP